MTPRASGSTMGSATYLLPPIVGAALIGYVIAFITAGALLIACREVTNQQC